MSYHEGKPNVLFTGNDVSKGLFFFFFVYLCLGIWAQQALCLCMFPTSNNVVWAFCPI